MMRIILMSKLYDYILSKSKVEKILNHYNIDYENKNGTYWMCCPFHSETKPSFSYNENNIFGCWGCKKKGNSISFIKDYELLFNDNELSYYESAMLLSRICDIKVNRKYKDIIDDEFEDINSISDIVETEFSTFNNNIFDIEQETFDDSIISKFYIKKNDYMVNRGYNQETLEYLEMGFYTGDKKNVMNDRCIFPIRNIKGELVGWTGRSIFKDANIKWLHAPSKRFKKAINLYNIDKAYNHIIDDDCVNVVESVCNVISLIESGRYNTVATLGSTISKEQCDMLKSFDTKIVIWYDWDNGGFEGINLIFEYFDNYDNLYIAITDYGKDENGKSYDLGDVSKYDIDNTEIISAYSYIKMVKENYIDNMKEDFEKDTVIKLTDGTEVLCSKRNKKTDIAQFNDNDIFFIKEISSLCGVNEFCAYTYQ